MSTPREVEEVLLEHPGVAELAVVGAPDEEWGEVVELDARPLQRIARFKRPKRYVFVAALSKNSHGKVPKRDLRNQLA